MLDSHILRVHGEDKARVALVTEPAVETPGVSSSQDQNTQLSARTTQSPRLVGVINPTTSSQPTNKTDDAQPTPIVSNAQLHDGPGPTSICPICDWVISYFYLLGNEI